MEESYPVKDVFFNIKFPRRKYPFNDYALLKLSKKVEVDELIPLDGNWHKLREPDSSIVIYGYPESELKWSE